MSPTLCKLGRQRLCPSVCPSVGLVWYWLLQLQLLTALLDALCDQTTEIQYTQSVTVDTETDTTVSLFAPPPLLRRSRRRNCLSASSDRNANFDRLHQHQQQQQQPLQQHHPRRPSVRFWRRPHLSAVRRALVIVRLIASPLGKSFLFSSLTFSLFDVSGVSVFLLQCSLCVRL